MSDELYTCMMCDKNISAVGNVYGCKNEPLRPHVLREFITKDSGERQEFSTGMKRDTQNNKPRYDLLDLPMLRRWAELMARGAVKYGEHNWKKAETEEELKRFDASLLRHTFQLLEGDRTEDHGAAIMFNVAGREMVLEKLTGKLMKEVNEIDSDIRSI